MSRQETIYLLRSPANARRPAESVAEAERAKGDELIVVQARYRY